MVHLWRELARLGFWVGVYAGPKGNDVGINSGTGKMEGRGGVVWYDVSNLLMRLER